MGIQVDISPIKADGSWKNAEDCFLEAFNKVSETVSPLATPSEFASNRLPVKRTAEILIKRYGADWVGWLPETIRKQIEIDYGDVPETVFQKIFSVKILLSNDEFWNNIYVFQNIILAFNDVFPDFGYLQEVSPAQVAYGIKEARSIREFDFDPIVKHYIRNVLFDHGLFVSPEELQHLDLNMSSGLSYDDINSDDEETFEGIQAAKLNAIKIYEKERSDGSNAQTVTD